MALGSTERSGCWRIARPDGSAERDRGQPGRRAAETATGASWLPTPPRVMSVGEGPGARRRASQIEAIGAAAQAMFVVTSSCTPGLAGDLRSDRAGHADGQSDRRRVSPLGGCLSDHGPVHRARNRGRHDRNRLPRLDLRSDPAGRSRRCLDRSRKCQRPWRARQPASALPSVTLGTRRPSIPTGRAAQAPCRSIHEPDRRERPRPQGLRGHAPSATLTIAIWETARRSGYPWSSGHQPCYDLMCAHDADA